MRARLSRFVIAMFAILLVPTPAHAIKVQCGGMGGVVKCEDGNGPPESPWIYDWGFRDSAAVTAHVTPLDPMFGGRYGAASGSGVVTGGAQYCIGRGCGIAYAIDEEDWCRAHPNSKRCPTVAPLNLPINPLGVLVAAVLAPSSTASSTVARLLAPNRSLLPDVCSGGGFGYGGVEGKLGPVAVELLGVVNYDSKEGGQHGGIVALQAGRYVGGFESTRTWNGWEEHTSPIGFVGGHSPISRKLGPVNVRTGDYGLLGQWIDGELALGGYGGLTAGGGRAFGGGAYLSLSWTGCE